MFKIIEVAKREYLATVRTKSFLVSLLLTPMVIVLILFITDRPNKAYTGEVASQEIVIIDQIGTLKHEITQVFSEYNQGKSVHQVIIEDYIDNDPNSDKCLKGFSKEILNGKIDAYLLIDGVDPNGTILLNFYSQKRTDSDFALFNTVKMLIGKAVLHQKYKLHSFSHNLIKSLSQGIYIQHIGVSAQLDLIQNSGSDMLIVFFYMYIMYMGIFSTSQRMLSGLIEEKNTRIIEVLLSILTPFQLMAGKIFGLASVGLTLVGFWLSAAHFFLMNKGITETLSLSIIGYFFIYYILGFLLFSSLMAAVGSICNSNKEAHNYTVLISLILIVPMILCTHVFEKPDSILATFLSIFPLTAPVAMVHKMLFCAEVSHFYALLAILLLIASILIGIRLSAKIFRIGILMYGKPPKIREILRWLKYE
ncbi:MAG: ABC transporter permease [Aliifodinibius sp.]|nr:ABC transporter permease [Fodinibius sp.]NIV12540.1 ABC transporter permease [Fodinibius sp.]NIY26242.1 ABC transporter permease [Fodinibius sp.]